MKKGFTLAEVLVTITVLGFVGIMTIPELVKNMNDYAYGKSKEVTLYKITEATNQMKSNDVLAGYATNDAFVSEFEKYMKITKKCDSSNLINCFPAKFTTTGGQEINTASLTMGTQIGSKNIASNTVGMMLANGTSILFSLRDSSKVGTDCDRIDPVDNQKNTTSCMSFLYDVNGFSKPNVVGKDINLINADVAACTTFGSLCVDAADTLQPYDPINTCTDTTWDSSGSSNSECAANYWAAARKMCAAKGMRLPTIAEYTSVLYPNRVAIGGFTPTPWDGFVYYAEDTLANRYAYYYCFQGASIAAATSFNSITYKGAPYSAGAPFRCVK